jgi:hypothetical protein
MHVFRCRSLTDQTSGPLVEEVKDLLCVSVGATGQEVLERSGF